MWLWSLTSISDSLTAKIIITIKILFSDIISPLIPSWNWFENDIFFSCLLPQLLCYLQTMQFEKGRYLPLFGIKNCSHHLGNNTFSIQQVDLSNIMDESFSPPLSVLLLGRLIFCLLFGPFRFFFVGVSIGGV